jgi:hypothetical protein
MATSSVGLPGPNRQAEILCGHATADSATKRSRPLLGSKADRAGRRRCRDRVVVFLDMANWGRRPVEVL